MLIEKAAEIHSAAFVVYFEILNYNVIQYQSTEGEKMNALVQTRVDSRIKSEAAAILEYMGLTVSDAVRLLLVRIAREKALPFEIWHPNAETISAMQDAEAGNMEEVSLEELKKQLNEIC